MASTKLATLAIRTIAKPISNQLKVYAQSNERFRGLCVSLAQQLWRTEIRLRENLLGERHHSPRPLSENKAIQNGANALAEGFLFAVAAGLIVAEAYRSARANTRRRGDVDERIEELEARVAHAHAVVQRLAEQVRGVEEQGDSARAQHDELSRVLSRIVDIGLRGGWAEFEGDPVPIPRGAHLQGAHHIARVRAHAPVSATERPISPPTNGRDGEEVDRAIARKTEDTETPELHGSKAGQREPPSPSS